MLDVGVTEGDDDCGERVGGGGDKEVGGGDDDGKPVGGGWGKGGTARGELEKKNIYRIGYRFGSIQIGSAKREAYQ